MDPNDLEEDPELFYNRQKESLVEFDLLIEKLYEKYVINNNI